MNETLFVIEEALYLGIWAFIGSFLGFFAFSNNPAMIPIKRFKRCLLSIGVGVFIAFPVFTYLTEYTEFSTKFSIMISGLSAFGLPDFILKHYPKLLCNSVYKLTKNNEINPENPNKNNNE